MKPTAKRPLPPELFDALASRTEGQELAQLWDLLEIATPTEAAPSAEHVWADVEAAIGTERAAVSGVASHSAPSLRLESNPVAQAVSPASPASPAAAAVGASSGNATHSAAARASRRWHPAAPWALAATLAVAAGLGVWQSQPITVRAAAGEQLAVTLPDGSTAELNAGSELKYSRGFRRFAGLLGTSRAVSLNGEAFFSVERGEAPFTVRTSNAAVTVLGTQFMVRDYTRDSLGTQVAVEEGRVRVQAAVRGPLDSAVTLAAGQGTMVPRGATAPNAATVAGLERLTAWRLGGLSFVDQPIEATFRELERRYALTITTRDVVFGDELIRLYYSERPTIERVLSDLCTPSGLQFSRTSRGFEISPQTGRPTNTP